MTLLGILLTGFVAMLLCGVAHWATEVLTHGALGPIWRYVLGTACISLPFASWLVVHASPVAVALVLAAWGACVVGAGLGTALAHLADRVAGQERALRLERSRHGEPDAR